MSDTPKTDAAQHAAINRTAHDALYHAYTLTRTLERENAALRAAHDKVIMEFRRVEAELQLLRASINISDVLHR